MTGLKSGSGDDLWGDDGGDESESASDTNGSNADSGRNQSAPSDEPSSGEGRDGRTVDVDGAAHASDSGDAGQPYIVRRAVRDRSVQFERDERLTFFVHDDVAEGERDLLTDLESTLGRDVPKFDVREAVYRAALRNREDVLDELLAMGYSVDDE